MEKDSTYWNKHKEIFNKMISELDTEIANKICNNPNCQEGKLLQKRVDKKVEEALEPTV